MPRDRRRTPHPPQQYTLQAPAISAGDGDADTACDPLTGSSADKHIAHSVLTEREVQVLRLVAEGKSNKEIARCLHITTHTAKAHVSRILYKLGVHSRTEAAVHWTRQTGLAGRG